MIERAPRNLSHDDRPFDLPADPAANGNFGDEGYARPADHLGLRDEQAERRSWGAKFDEVLGLSNSPFANRSGPFIGAKHSGFGGEGARGGLRDSNPARSLNPHWTGA